MNNDDAQLLGKQTSTYEEDSYVCVTLCILVHFQQHQYNNSVQSVDRATFLQTHTSWICKSFQMRHVFCCVSVGLSNWFVFRIYFCVDSMFDSVSGVASGGTPHLYFLGVLPKSLGDSVFVFWQIWPKKASSRTGTSQIYIYILIYIYICIVIYIYSYE